MVLYTPEMRPVILDHSGELEMKDTEEATITPVDEDGNEIVESSEVVLAQIEVKSADSAENNDE